MFLSPPIARPYRRNIRRDPTSPASASESVATRKLAPRGMITRFGVPCGVGPQALSAAQPASAAQAPTSVTLRSVRTVQRLLQENRRGQSVDLAFPSTRRLSQLTHGPERDGGGEALIQVTHRQLRSLSDFVADCSDFRRPIGFVSIAVKRKTEQESLGLELGRAPDDLGDGRPLSLAARDESGRSRDHSERVADCQPNSLATVVYGHVLPQSADHIYRLVLSHLSQHIHVVIQLPHLPQHV